MDEFLEKAGSRHVFAVTSAFFVFQAFLFRANGWPGGAFWASIDSIVSGLFWFASAIVPMYWPAARTSTLLSLGLNSIAASATGAAAVLSFGGV